MEEVHTDEHGEWQGAQDPSGQPTLRSTNSHLSVDPYALTNHMRSLIQDLSQVAAGLLLNQDRGDQKLQIGNRHTAAKVGHCLAEWQAEALFIGRTAKLRTQGFVRFQRYRLYAGR